MDYISLKDAAQRLGLPVTTLWYRFQKSDLPRHKVGYMWLVRLDDIKALCADRLKSTEKGA